jgi:hypothetical protein
VTGQAPAPARPFDAYPGLFHAADAAAVVLQRRHFFWEGVLLALTPVSAAAVLGVALGLIQLQGAMLTAVSTSLIVLLLWVVRASRWQAQWYACRGLAEDVKRATWRYVMALDPFPPGAADPDAAFVRRLHDAVREQPDVLRSLGERDAAPTPPVTEEMRRLREAGPAERDVMYRASRLRPESAWYSRKARGHLAEDRAWFVVLVTVQAIAVIVAIILAVQVRAGGEASPVADSLVPLLSAVGVAVMGWQRSRRYGDLAISYSSTAQELAGLESDHPDPSDEAAYLRWLERVEATLAQEHEAWRHMT